MATINPGQEYDIIHTLTYASSGGTDQIRLYRGTASYFTGTVYYRAGTSGAWTSLSVSGNSTTFPITSTTMQIAHDWNKSGNDYMTPSFQDGTMTGIAISQKAVLSGAVGSYFMYYYARGCSDLTTLGVPDTSGLTSAGSYFTAYYANNCTSLTQLNLPKAGWFKTNNVNWSVPSGRLGVLRGYVPDSANLADWKALTVSGKTLYINYIQSVNDVYTDDIPALQVWTGIDWKPGKVWDGSTWRGDAKVWDGNQWV